MSPLLCWLGSHRCVPSHMAGLTWWTEARLSEAPHDQTFPLLWGLRGATGSSRNLGPSCGTKKSTSNHFRPSVMEDSLLFLTLGRGGPNPASKRLPRLNRSLEALASAQHPASKRPNPASKAGVVPAHDAAPGSSSAAPLRFRHHHHCPSLRHCRRRLQPCH